VSLSFQIGKTKLFFGLSYHEIKNNEFDKDRIGLNHLAFGVGSLKELKKFGGILDKTGIKNRGIKTDK
jgi:hypothetical protein